MGGNLTDQVRNIAQVTTAVARGDLSRKITVDVRGEILETERHHQHDGGSAHRLCVRSDARRASEVGTEGKLGRPGAGAGASPVPGRT